MFPNHGEGFIWDKVNINGDQAEATLFVPESKKIFNVSISTKDIKNRDDLTCIQWIEWKGVGERDACKPIPLIDVSLIKQGDSTIFPEFTNQTTFRSVLLFPKRQELIDFVGKNNAWSPFVGIVSCDEKDVTRGAYAVSYIERDYDKAESAFRVNVKKLKFPEGYIEEEDEPIFKGLEKEIESAAEEAAVLANKGKYPGGDSQVIPLQRRTQDDGQRGVGKIAHVGRPRGGARYMGPRRVPKEEAEMMNQLVKDNRYQLVIVYKKKDKGFMGWSSLLGSLPIYTYHDAMGRSVEIGDSLNTRVEYNKRSGEFEVDKIEEIENESPIEFTIREGKRGIDLLITCLCLDLSEFKLLEGKWNGKRVGVIEHPNLSKVLAYEEDVMKKEWKGKKVKATLLHYERIEEHNDHRIRLVLEKIDGLFDDGSWELPIVSSKESHVPANIRVSMDSDDDDDDEEGEEGECNVYSDEDREEKEHINMTRVEQKRPINDCYNGGEFDTRKSYNQRGYERQYDGGGYGRSERGGGGNGGRYRGGRGGNNQRMSYHRPSSEPWSGESNGFGHDVPQQKKSIVYDRGILVCYSTRSSVFYSFTDKIHKVIEFEGNASVHGLDLGDSAEFEREPSKSSRFQYRVAYGSLVKIPDIFHLTMITRDRVLYIGDRGSLTPHRDIFECNQVSDIVLDSSRFNLKLYSGKFIEKSRVKIGHEYDIYLRFNEERMEWEFECIDDRAVSYAVEGEDEIDRFKRLNKEREMNQSRNSSNRSEDDWENIDSNDHRSSSGSSYVPRPSSRGNEYSNDGRSGQSQFSIPSAHTSTTPSIRSDSTQRSTTTLTSDKMRNLRKENEQLKRMLKSVWTTKDVQKCVKQDNYFLYESVEDWINTEAEDESERIL